MSNVFVFTVVVPFSHPLDFVIPRAHLPHVDLGFGACAFTLFGFGFVEFLRVEVLGRVFDFDAFAVCLFVEVDV